VYRLFASGRSVAANIVVNDLPKRNSKALLQSASSILDNALSRSLFNGFGQSRRMLVTQQTYKSLQEAIPGKIDISKVSPYQKHGLCAGHATRILKTRLAEARQADSASSLALLWGKGWDQVKEAMVGVCVPDSLPFNAEELLAKFNEKGILTLRGPGLGESYNDHEVAVFSVSKINVPGKGPKIVVGVIDCNDQATDPETMASRVAAVRMGKSHPSELTHEEADKHGAHLRRIRFMDGDSLLKHIRACTKQCMHLIDNGEMSYPEIFVPRRGIPALTADESAKLSQILVEIYDTPEVEKFESQDAGRFEQDAAAQRESGRAMAQRLYKAVVKE